MTPRRWWWRLAIAAVLYAGLLAGFVWGDFDPDPVRLALLVSACVALGGLLIDSVGEGGVSWSVAASGSLTPAGQDPRLSTYLRVLESHLTARAPDPAVRSRLAALADQRLEQRHGVTRADPRGRELLGPELTGLLSGGTRPLTREEIDRHLRRIERL